MQKMLFTSSQPMVSITKLPNGKRDVMVLINEQYAIPEPTEEEPNPQGMYRYDGNSFRTVYDLTENEILPDLDKWLNYSPIGEPTLEQIQHDNELTDRLVLELVEGGIL